MAINMLQAIPPNWMASVAVAEAEEEALLTAVTGSLPNVTAVATRQVLQTIHDLVQHVAGAVRVLAVAALVAAVLGVLMVLGYKIDFFFPKCLAWSHARKIKIQNSGVGCALSVLSFTVILRNGYEKTTGIALHLYRLILTDAGRVYKPSW
ncbi:MAG: hypothetical protein HQM04_16775 [Magnetococcales bacterium]|nr:hypothetical protein [Magnetococcales bacterium]MBF0116685.1 hypothetical protein [Magnetococcales bacterium]